MRPPDAAGVEPLSSEGKNLVIVTAKWVLPISSPPIEDGFVRIEGDTIVAVGTHGEVAPEAGEEIIDFGQGAILPGFVDLHTHLEYSVLRGLVDDLPYTPWKLQVMARSAVLAPEDWAASSELGALEAIQSGITCIADMTSSGVSFGAAAKSGLRGVIFHEVSGMDTSAIDGLIGKARETIERLISEASPTNLQVGIGPHSPYGVCAELYGACGRLARDHDLALCTHLAGSPDEYEFVKYGSSELGNTFREMMGWSDIPWQPTGVSPIKYLEQWGVFEVPNAIGVHCVQVSRDDIEILRKYDVGIVHCPKCSAKLGMGIAPLSVFRERGTRVAIGTDSPASNNVMDMFDEMRTGLLLQRGVSKSVEPHSAESFVRMATLGGAQVLKMTDSIGSLEAGKKADVICVDLSHSHQIPTGDPYSAIVYTANQEDVRMTMVGGRMLFRDGDCLTLDRDDIEARSGPIRSKLRR